MSRVSFWFESLRLQSSPSGVPHGWSLGSSLFISSHLVDGLSDYLDDKTSHSSSPVTPPKLDCAFTFSRAYITHLSDGAWVYFGGIKHAYK